MEGDSVDATEALTTSEDDAGASDGDSSEGSAAGGSAAGEGSAEGGSAAGEGSAEGGSSGGSSPGLAAGLGSSDAELVAAARSSKHGYLFGDDRAITNPPNWASHDTHQLYDGAIRNNDPGAVQATGDAWCRQGAALNDAAHELFDTITKLGHTWMGKAAGAAQDTLAAIATSSESASDAANEMGLRVGQQADAAAELKKMPPPQEFDPNQAVTALIDGGPEAMTDDLKAQADAARSVKEQQIAYCNAYTAELSDCDGRTPSFGPESLALRPATGSGMGGGGIGGYGTGIGSVGNATLSGIAGLAGDTHPAGHAPPGSGGAAIGTGAGTGAPAGQAGPPPGTAGAPGGGEAEGGGDSPGAGESPATVGQGSVAGDSGAAGSGSAGSGFGAAAGAGAAGAAAGLGAGLGARALAKGTKSASRAPRDRRDGHEQEQAGPGEQQDGPGGQQTGQQDGAGTKAEADATGTGPAAPEAARQGAGAGGAAPVAGGMVAPGGSGAAMGAGGAGGAASQGGEQDREHQSFLIEPDPDELFGPGEAMLPPVIGLDEEEQQ